MAVQIDLGAVVPIGKGEWNTDTIYERANMVRHNSSAWVCKVKQSQGKEPIEGSSDWYLLVKDTSSVTSVNGETGDVTLDFEHVNTPSLEDSSNRVANTEFINQKLEPVSQQLNSLSEQLNTLDTDSVKGSNVSVLPKANSIPKTDASGKLNKGWLPTNLENVDIEISNLKDNKANINGDNAPQLVNTYESQEIVGHKQFNSCIYQTPPKLNTYTNYKHYFNLPNYDENVPPIEQEYTSWDLRAPAKDKNAEVYIGARRNTNNILSLEFHLRRFGVWSSIYLEQLPNKEAHVKIPALSPSASGFEATTAQWVRERLAENGSQVVKTWHSGTQWYRKYSDGFIIQGGRYAPNPDRYITVNYNIPFTVRPTILGTPHVKSENWLNYRIFPHDGTTTNFSIDTGNAPGYWVAFGY